MTRMFEYSNDAGEKPFYIQPGQTLIGCPLKYNDASPMPGSFSLETTGGLTIGIFNSEETAKQYAERLGCFYVSD